MSDRLQEIQDYLDLIKSPGYKVYEKELNKLLEWAQKQVNKGTRETYDKNIGKMEGILMCINIEKKLKYETRNKGRADSEMIKTIALTEVDSAGDVYRTLIPLDVMRKTIITEWSSKDDQHPGACSVLTLAGQPEDGTAVRETLTEIEVLLIEANADTPDTYRKQQDEFANEFFYDSYVRLLEAIPKCPTHGPCLPHALEWIEERKQST
jgi:hypothetical protein